MELSSTNLNALKCLSGTYQNGTTFSNETYSILIQCVFDSFVVNSNKKGKFELNLDTKTIENSGKTSAELKDASSILFLLISEMAKHDLDSNSISTFLEDVGFTNERISLFKEHYEKKISIIRLFLSSPSFSFPHIVDVNWRLDYCMKENNMERINEPIYLIDLKVEKPGHDALDTIQFQCSIEQLQDFVQKLKEATKSVEKLTQ